MAILDIFKKKLRKVPSEIRGKKEIKGKPKPAPAPRRAPKQASKQASKLASTPVATPLPQRPKKASASAYRILKKPHVTEKATDLTKLNQYVFEVYSRANKTEIGKVIQDVYGVDVLDVKIINIPKKKRRLGRVEGWRKGYKKAIVKIGAGQKIEVLPR